MNELLIIVIGGFAFALTVCWIIFPFIVSHQLGDLKHKTDETHRLLRESNLYLASIDKNSTVRKTVGLPPGISLGP